ncbi:MAG TPA: hypothetical protein VFZ75_04585 [Actinomycetota bacterium]|nr:hypothetical protein [Actinomycetota bacterium]
MTERNEPENPWEGDDGSELEADIMQADHASGAEQKGTTAEEQREGRNLDEALARERPDAPTSDETFELVDEGDPDVEAELVAEGSVAQDEFASPEEAALSVRPDAPGATDHDDPHPTDEG